MGTDIHHPTHLTEPYTWCQDHLLSLAALLVKFSGFEDIEPSDERILFSLAPTPKESTFSRGFPRFNVPQNQARNTRDSNPIELPVTSAAFFTPGHESHWYKMFQNPILAKKLEYSDYLGTNPMRDLLNTLQCLLPGMFLLIEQNEGYSTTRGIPSRNWILENRNILISCLGEDRYEALRDAAGNERNAVIVEREKDVATEERERNAIVMQREKAQRDAYERSQRLQYYSRI